MVWLKRNLLLVVGGLVALGLMGIAGYYLFTQIEARAAVTEQLNAQTEELNRLVSRGVYPNQDNIESAKKEQVRLEGLYQDVAKFYAPSEIPAQLDSAKFKSFLEFSIHELNQEAERFGVVLPSKYDFTFTSQRKTLTFAESSLMPLSSQIAQLKSLLKTVFNSKIHSLVGIRRVPAQGEEKSGSTAEFMNLKIETNAVTGAILTPYEITFQCFNNELGEVLTRLLTAPQCFIVKSVTVEKGTPIAKAAESMAVMPASAGGMPADVAARYGLRPQAPVAAAPAATARGGLQTVLEEQPIKVTLLVTAVQLKPKQPDAAPKPAPAQPTVQ